MFVLSFLLSISVSSFLRSSNNIYRSSNNGNFLFIYFNPVEQYPPGKCVLLTVDFKIQVNFQCILDIMLCCYMHRIDWIGLSFTTLFCWIYGISSVSILPRRGNFHINMKQFKLSFIAFEQAQECYLYWYFMLLFGNSLKNLEIPVGYFFFFVPKHDLLVFPLSTLWITSSFLIAY